MPESKTTEPAPESFTGERVIPGEVNADLWSEHVARYALARRYAAGFRVLDAGCGTGYGAAELAQSAAAVTGIDLSTPAINYSRQHYPLPNIRFLAGSCVDLPFAASSFDVVVAFEVIEHLEAYRRFVEECGRVLTANGLFIVSTPNKLYYGESRADAGSNPYHEHEFEAAEFREELQRVFPNTALLAQNRVECFAFHPIKTFWPAEARIDGGGGSANDAHFFIALCSRAALPEPRSFVYVPKAANLLREREQHVQLLETQLCQTRAWLRDMQEERDQLLTAFRAQKEELEQRNVWAQKLNSELAESYKRIEQLQQELASEQQAANEMAAGYEAKVRELDAANVEKTAWALETEQRLTAELQARANELAACVQLLAVAEATVEERTLWAQRADQLRAALETQLNAVRASRWIKLGRKLGVGPALENAQ